MQSLRNLARSYSNNELGVTFYMLPYMPAIASVYHSQMAERIGDREWSTLENIFLLVSTSTIDLELTDDATDTARQIAAFWSMRTNNPLEDYDLWLTVMSDKCVYAWHDAYQKTRVKLLEARDVLKAGRPSDGDDPLDLKKPQNGSVSSKRKLSLQSEPL